MPLADFLSMFTRRRPVENTADNARPERMRWPASAARASREVIETKLLHAVKQHRQGHLTQAEAIYHEILRLQPRHFDALHYLGLIALQQGRTATGVEQVMQAIEIDGSQAAAWANLATGLQQLGRHGESLECYQRALSLKPESIELHISLSSALLHLQRHEEVLTVCERGLQIDSGTVDLHRNRAVALLALRRHEEALAACGRAHELQPGTVEVLLVRGTALLELRRFQDAITDYDSALAQKPEIPSALNNRGLALAALGRHMEALSDCERALALEPGFVEALNNRGAVLVALNKNAEALASCERALQLKADYADAYNNRGNALRNLHRLEEALASYELALRYRPDFPEALNNHAAVLSGLGRFAEAAASYARLLEQVPGHDYALGKLLYCRLHCCEWAQCDQLGQSIARQVKEGKKVISPFAFLSVSESAAAQLQCARIHVADLYPAAADPLWKGERYRHRKVRVAYLSADFHNHATAYLMAGLFEAHDRQRFELVAISFGPAMQDEMRSRLQRSFDHFIDVRGKSDADAARLIREMEIDIAVDLKGFTFDSRPGIFAYRPAPIQVNYLGYPGTMGAEYIDYIIADRHVVPEEDREYYSEEVVYLPHSYQVNDSQRMIAAHVPTRAQAGLPDSGFVFCSFNNNNKVTPTVFDVWMRLLQRCPESVLWLIEGNPAAAANLRREAKTRGVAPERIVFAPRIAQAEHLARQKLADLFLDTLPYNAHTTTSDALWAGLPVLTCKGRSFAGRVAAGLLHAAGLPELVTESLAHYEAMALELASSPHRLAAFKARLAVNRTTCPLFDTQRFCHHIEAAYLQMWERYQHGEPPKGFSVLL